MTFGAIFAATLCLRTGQHPILNSAPTEVEAAVKVPVRAHPRAAYPSLSLGSYFHREDVALEGGDRFSHESAKEKREGAERLSKVRNQHGSRALFPDVQKRCRDEGVKAGMPWKPPWSGPGPFGSTRPGSGPRRPPAP